MKKTKQRPAKPSDEGPLKSFKGLSGLMKDLQQHLDDKSKVSRPSAKESESGLTPLQRAVQEIEQQDKRREAEEAFAALRSGGTGPASSHSSSLTALNQNLSKGADQAARSNVITLLEMPGLPNKARSSLNRMGVALRRKIQINNDPATASKSRSILADCDRTISEALSNVNFYLMSEEEKEGETFNLSGISISLPYEVDGVSVAKAIPLVVKVEEGQKAPPNSKRLAESVFLSNLDLIGVPDTGDREAEFKLVRDFCWKEHKIEPHPIPLTRPDSLAVWFPFMTTPCSLESAIFPDQSRISAKGPTAEDRSVTSMALASIRRTFEERNADLYSRMKRARRVIDTSTAIRASLKQEFESLTDGLHPSSRESVVLAKIAESLRIDLLGEKDISQRLAKNLKWKKHKEKVLEVKEKYASASLRIKKARAVEEAIEEKIEELKKKARGGGFDLAGIHPQDKPAQAKASA